MSETESTSETQTSVRLTDLVSRKGSDIRSITPDSPLQELSLPELIKWTAALQMDKREKTTGVLTEALRRFPETVVLRKVQSRITELYHSHHSGELRITRSESTDTTEPTITCEIARGADQPFGQIHFTLMTERVPVATLAVHALPEVISGKQEYLTQRFSSLGINAAVAPAGWCTHHIITYDDSLEISPELVNNSSTNHIRSLAKAFYWHPPGRGANAYKEFYAIHTPITSSEHPDWNDDMFQYDVFHEPDRDISGYGGASSQHVVYEYTDQGWQFTIADSHQMHTRILNPSKYPPFTSWKPLLILDQKTSTQFDHISTEKQLLFPSAMFILQGPNGRILGNISADLTCLLSPSELWNLTNTTTSTYGELTQIFYCDAGGSNGIAFPDRSVGRTWNPNLAKSPALGPTALRNTLSPLLAAFPPYHTIGQIHACVFPQDIARVM